MNAGQQGIEHLRRAWHEALETTAPGVSAEEVLDRLEKKYRDLADRQETAGGAA